MSPCRSRWSGVRLSSTATSERERRDQLELVGRQLQHVDAAPPERRRGRAPAADIAADLAPRRPASARMWPISAVVVDLPLVPVMPTIARACGCARASSSTSPMIGDAGGARRAPPRDAAWGRCAECRATAPARSMPRPVDARRSASANAGRRPRRAPAALSSQASDVDAGRRQRARRGAGRCAPARARRTRLPSRMAEIDHRAHRSFRVARPTSARIMAMIQKRITMVGSCPALLLEMMVQRRHAEDALAGQLERGDLDDHRDRLEHEQAADDRQHELVLGDDRDRAERAADRRASRCRP